jgi:hypothetical protein
LFTPSPTVALPRIEVPGAAEMSTDGEVANALVCKISIRGFNSRSVLQQKFKLMQLFHCLISEAVGAFSRRRVFGCTAVAFSSVAIALFDFFLFLVLLTMTLSGCISRARGLW